MSTEFRQDGIPWNFLTSEVISAKFRRNSAEFRGIPRNFAGIAPEITSVYRGMPKCHFRGHPSWGAIVTEFKPIYIHISVFALGVTWPRFGPNVRLTTLVWDTGKFHSFYLFFASLH